MNDPTLDDIDLQLDELETEFNNSVDELYEKWDTAYRSDSRLMNAMTKVGMEEDPGSHTKLGCLERIPDTELENLYTGHDLCAKVCDFYPERMISEGILLDGGESKDSRFAGWADQKLKELNAYVRVREALTWSNVYGSAVILMDIDDGQPYDQPVDVDKIKSIRGLIVKDKTELQPLTLLTDDIYDPTYYRLHMEESIGESDALNELRRRVKSTNKDIIHSSRVLRFDGIKAPKRKAKQNNGWGYSVLTRFKHHYFAYQIALQDLQGMVSKFEIPILKIQNLVGKLSKDKTAEGKVYARLKMLTTSIKNLGAIVCDKEHEDVEYLTRSLTGLAELLDRFAFRVVTAADIPETQLFGRSSVGAGFSDAGLKERFYVAQKTKTLQEAKLREPFQKLLRYVLAADENPYAVSDIWSFDFIDTMQLTPKELADLKESQATVDSIEIEWGIVSAEEIRMSRHGGARWSPSTILLSKKIKKEANGKDQVKIPKNEKQNEENKEIRTDSFLNGIDVTVPGRVKTNIKSGLTKLRKIQSNSSIKKSRITYANSLLKDGIPTLKQIKEGYTYTIKNRRAAVKDKTSEAYVEWLLMGGMAGASWYRKLYRQILKNEGVDIKTVRTDDNELIGYIPQYQDMDTHLIELALELEDS